MTTLQKNQHIQQVDLNGNKIGKSLKKKMKIELEKNKQINGLIENNLIEETPHRGKHTINLKNRAYQDISFLQKLMCNEDFA